eukprot:403340886
MIFTDSKLIKVYDKLQECCLSFIESIIDQGYYTLQFFEKLMDDRKDINWDLVLDKQIIEKLEQQKNINSNELEWRLALSDKSLQVEQQCLDCLDKSKKRGQFFRSNFEDWQQFQIIDTYEDILVLQQIQVQNNFILIGRWSKKIALFNTTNQEILTWKQTLKPGRKILLDDGYVMTESTILEVSHGLQKSDVGLGIADIQQATDIHELKIGLRVYRSNGKKIDDIGSYYGWSSKYDQWVPLYSSSIQPKLAFEVGYGELEFVKYLLEKKYEGSQIPLNLAFDNKLLIHKACKRGKVDIAKYLVDNQIC